jgi:hypothetical protein
MRRIDKLVHHFIGRFAEHFAGFEAAVGARNDPGAARKAITAARGEHA